MGLIGSAGKIFRDLHYAMWMITDDKPAWQRPFRYAVWWLRVSYRLPLIFYYAYEQEVEDAQQYPEQPP